MIGMGMEFWGMRFGGMEMGWDFLTHIENSSTYRKFQHKYRKFQHKYRNVAKSPYIIYYQSLKDKWNTYIVLPYIKNI